MDPTPHQPLRSQQGSPPPPPPRRTVCEGLPPEGMRRRGRSAHEGRLCGGGGGGAGVRGRAEYWAGARGRTGKLQRRGRQTAGRPVGSGSQCQTPPSWQPSRTGTEATRQPIWSRGWQNNGPHPRSHRACGGGCPLPALTQHFPIGNLLKKKHMLVGAKPFHNGIKGQTSDNTFQVRGIPRDACTLTRVGRRRD